MNPTDQPRKDESKPVPTAADLALYDLIDHYVHENTRFHLVDWPDYKELIGDIQAKIDAAVASALDAIEEEVIGADVDPYFTNEMGLPEPDITLERKHRNKLRTEQRQSLQAVRKRYL